MLLPLRHYAIFVNEPPSAPRPLPLGASLASWIPSAWRHAKWLRWFRRKPSTQGLLESLADAEEEQVIAPDARQMLEGVLRMASLTVGEVMVAAPRMDALDVNASRDALLATVSETAHSRFPVYEGSRDNIIGILLAKDLLKLQRSPQLHLRAMLRAPAFVPESKRLDDLLREFRATRNHLAVVIDEFGQVAGLITIEDVLEEIVGEIEDEFDEAEDNGDIFSLADGTWRVAGDTAVARINEAFEVRLPEDDFDTIGGWIAHEMGHVPQRGELFEVQGLQFAVLLARGGAVRWFKVARMATDAAALDASA